MCPDQTGLNTERETLMFDSYAPHGVSSLHGVIEDRDLSRAASERYLILEALAERRAAARTRVHRLPTWLPRPVHAAWTRTRAATAEVPCS